MTPTPLLTRVLTILSLLACVSLSTGCATDQNVLAQADQVHGSLEPAVINDQQVSNYLQQVGERIIASAREADAQHIGPPAHFKEKDQWMFSNDMQFHLVNSKTLNAFTTGGKHMYVYNELFQQCKSEDELAAVMAHEYAHVYCRHVAQGMNRQYGMLAAAAALGGAGYLAGGKEHGSQYAALGASGGAAIAQFANMGFTRGDEAQADEYGFKFYTMAGWDPRHFADFFKAMIAAGYDKTPGMLSDHPTLASRVEAANKRVAALGRDADRDLAKPIADPSTFRELQARAAKLAKTLPDDKSLQSSQKLLQALPRSCVAPVADPPDAQQARQDLVDNANAAEKSKKKKKTSSS